MNRKSKRLAARTADKVGDDDLESRESESVVDVPDSDVVGQESGTVIPVDIGIEDGVVTVSASSSDQVVSDVVVDVVAEEHVPLVRGGYDVVGDAETEVVGGEDPLVDVGTEENIDRRGRMKNKGDDIAERYHYHYH